MQLNNPKINFHVLGRADAAAEVIKNARVMLAPLRFGAGIKGKLLEAMQCGTPSITSSIGAEAMAGDLEWNGFVKDDPKEFVASAIALYSDVVLWEKSQKNGYLIIGKRYQKSSFENDFINRVYSLKENLKQHRNSNFMGSILQFHLNSSTKYMSKWIEEKNKKI